MTEPASPESPALAGLPLELPGKFQPVARDH